MESDDKLQGNLPGSLIFGTEGKSAYQLAVENGYEGTMLQWLESLNGPRGKSAYEYAVAGGYVGTEKEFAQKLAQDTVPRPASASVGQYLRVSAVDAEGKISAVEAATVPAGGSNSSAIDLEAYGITRADYAEPFTAEMYEVAYNNGVGIQNAINDAIAAGRTEIVIPPGNYPLCYHANAKNEYNPVINSCGINLRGYGAKLYVIYDEDGINPYYKWTDAELEENDGVQDHYFLMGKVILTDSDVVGLELVGERAYRKHENTKYRDCSGGIRLDTWTDGNTIKDCKIHHFSGDGIGNGMSLENHYISGEVECTPGAVVGGVITSNGATGLMSPRMGIGYSVDTSKPIIMSSTGYNYFLWTSKTPTIHCFDKDENYLGSLRNNQSEAFVVPVGTFYVYVELYMGNPDTVSYTGNFRFGNAVYRNTLIENCESYLNQRGGASNLPTGTVLRKCRIHDNGGAYGNMVAYYDGTQFGVDIEDWYIHNITFEDCVFYGQLHDILHRGNRISVKGCSLTSIFSSLNYAVDILLEDSKFYGNVLLNSPASFGTKKAVGCTFSGDVAPEINILDNMPPTPVSAVINAENRNLVDFRDKDGNIIFTLNLEYLGKEVGSAIVSDSLLFDLDLTKASADTLTIDDETGSLSATVASTASVTENGVCNGVKSTNTVVCTWNKAPDFGEELSFEMTCFGRPQSTIGDNGYKCTLISEHAQAGCSMPKTVNDYPFRSMKCSAPYITTGGETAYATCTTGYNVVLDDGTVAGAKDNIIQDFNSWTMMHVVLNLFKDGTALFYFNGYPSEINPATTDFAYWDMSLFTESFYMWRGNVLNKQQILKTARMYNKCLSKEEVRNNFKYELDRLGSVHRIIVTATNAAVDNTPVVVKENSAYSASVTANDGYALSAVTITMSGVDVTSSVYSDGAVDIEAVTGEVVITVTAEAEATE